MNDIIEDVFSQILVDAEHASSNRKKSYRKQIFFLLGITLAGLLTTLSSCMHW